MDTAFLADAIGLQILSYERVVGGDINSAYRLVTSSGSLFLKSNAYPFGSQMLQTESIALQHMNSLGAKTPEVISVLSSDKTNFLILEWIETGIAESFKILAAARALAQLHKNSSESFGYSSDNFLATWAQKNEYSDDWIVFYIHNRILPLVRDCMSISLLSDVYESKTWELKSLMEKRFPSEPPALIHGDLWTGNLMYTFEMPGYALVDPAICFASREMDIAMSKLFGGFSSSFYDAYQEVFPLQPEWEYRLPAYQLYYLLFHLKFFGKGYLGGVDRCFSHYGL